MTPGQPPREYVEATASRLDKLLMARTHLQMARDTLQAAKASRELRDEITAILRKLKSQIATQRRREARIDE